MDLKVLNITRAVTAAGTALPLVPGANTICTRIFLMAKKVTGDNTGNVFIGGAGVDKTSTQLIEMEPGDYFEIQVPDGHSIDANDVYVDAATSADGVVGFALLKQKA